MNTEKSSNQSSTLLGIGLLQYGSYGITLFSGFNHTVHVMLLRLE